MKKLFLALFIFSSVCSVNAQEPEESVKNFNEIKINGLYLVLGAFDLTYERTLNEESAIGATIFIPFDDETVNEDFNFYFSPYYRFYFGKKYAAGFFIEGFGLLSSYEQTSVEFGINDAVFTEENKLAMALGIGVGGKWVTNSGFLGELNLGIGRNIINGDDFIEDIIGKVSIGVGYRF
ncbi:DUF3575 domain-containing protein [Winogradskyella sp. PE311]|uniref:DUF3575 domain-containing protein n=1 Tax=Winogradskyella sp. PE311 TaxID=3366943 RepID=UPI00397F2CA9